jgi:hypothetical protein
MSELRNKVEEWIRRSGFSLEMSVAETLQSVGFSAVQAEFFKDPVTGAFRETDLVAFDIGVGNEVSLTFEIVCECKSCDHPWVLFSSTRDIPRSLAVTRRAATKTGAIALTALSHEKNVTRGLPFGLPKALGYTITTAALGNKKPPRDTAYDAIASVSAATVALIASDNAAGDATIAWPLVVLRGRLFEAILSADSRVLVEEVDRGVLGWRNPVIAPHSFIQVVTEPALDSLAKSLWAGWQACSSRAIQALENASHRG